MALACVTKRGRASLGQQAEVLRAVAETWALEVWQTPPELAADVDAIFARDGVVVAVAEVKARDMGADDLMEFGSYLVTADKLQRGMAVAKALRVPFLLIVGLMRDERVVYWKISDENGEPRAKWCGGPSLTPRNGASCAKRSRWARSIMRRGSGAGSRCSTIPGSRAR